MTPERSAEVLRSMRGSLASWVRALEAIPNKDRELKHLTVTMRQSLYTLDQLIEWEMDEGRE
jgi:hypothetical protein